MSDLIARLRRGYDDDGTVTGLLHEAADRLEQLEGRESEYSFEAFVAELHAKYPAEWERGYQVGLAGEEHDPKDILSGAYQAGWLYGNIARNAQMFIGPEDDGTQGVNPSVIMTSDYSRYKRGVPITDARARTERHCDL